MGLWNAVIKFQSAKGFFFQWKGVAIDIQSINQNSYSTPSRSLLRGTPDPGHAEKNSLEKVGELRTGTVWEVP